jgi:hypothetical protein
MNARYQKFDPTLWSENFNGRDFLKDLGVNRGQQSKEA